jgi:hypothetical protein
LESGSVEVMFDEERQRELEEAQQRMKGMSDRQKVITELLDTERSYVADLNQLCDVYEKPIRVLDMIGDYAYRRVFTNVVALRDTCVDLFNKLEAVRIYYFRSLSRLR